MKFYIAFSIHGTNTFIVAEKEAESVEALGTGFKAVNSRRFGVDSSKDGQKIFWDGFLNRETNQPYVSPSAVLKKMYVLRTHYGWSINSESWRRFIAFHFTKLRKSQQLKGQFPSTSRYTKLAQAGASF